MHVGYHVVERVDALEDNDLVLAELDGLRRRLDAHLARELILRHEDTLALGEHGEVLVQKLHVHAARRLQIHLALRCARHGGGVDGLEIVVHADIVRLDADVLQLIGQLHRGSGLAGAGRAGQQDDGAVLAVLRDQLRRLGNARLICRVTLFDEALRVGHGLEIDLFKLICHVYSSQSL